MKKDKYILMILSIFLILLVFAGTASAGDIDDEIELSSPSDIDEIVGVDDGAIGTDDENNNELEDDSSDDVTVTQDNAKETLNEGSTGSYADLSSEINGGEGGNIVLTKKTYTYSSGSADEIVINAPCIIDGNGCVIDMAESNIRAFFVNASNVTFKNLSIMNAHAIADGSAIFFNGSGSLIDCSFINNSAKYDNVEKESYSGGAAYFVGNGMVDNCNFTDNRAEAGWGGDVYPEYACGGALYFNGSGTVINSNFTHSTARWGAAIFFKSPSSVSNCIFFENTAYPMDGGYGYSFADAGAIYFESDGNVTNSNFTGNSAYNFGGAIRFNGVGNVTNSNFVHNWVRHDPDYGVGEDDEDYGGAIFFNVEGSVDNCNFTLSSAKHKGGAIYFSNAGILNNSNFYDSSTGLCGGAVYFKQAGIVDNSNFSGSSANHEGGAVYFETSAYVTNANFTGNNAYTYGGALYVMRGYDVDNCSFTSNYASSDGGAIFSFYADYKYNVTNSNFTNNRAGSSGGAIRLKTEGKSNIENCNFIGNIAEGQAGGAIYTDVFPNFILEELGNVTEVINCNFTGNTAKWNGGAIYFSYNGSVNYCNFTGNKATTGSAIYFATDTNSMKNTILLDNRANSNEVSLTQNEGIVTIKFTGADNLLNAIYSHGELDFENITYWGARGISNTGYQYFPNSHYEAGQNITITVNRSGIIREFVGVTDANGEITVDLTKYAADYNVSAYHAEDSYYSQSSVSSITFSTGQATVLDLNVSDDFAFANVTDGAKGNITFTITKENELVKEVNVNILNTYAELDISDLSVGTYNITATYNGDSNYRPSTKSIIYENYEIGIVVSEPVIYGEELVVNITVPSDLTGNVYIDLDGEFWSTNQINDTTYQANIRGLYPGKHIVNGVVRDDPKYTNKVSDNVSFVVKMIANANFDIVNGENEVTVTLKNLDGTPIANAQVLAIINGEERNITTDENGEFIIEHNGNITAQFEYVDENGVTVKSSTKVISEIEVVEVPVIPVRNATKIIYEDMTTTAVAPEDGRIGEYFHIQLVDANGKALAGKKVQIGFNGNVYNRTTDSNGKARLQINLKNAGTYTFAIAFLGDDEYNGSFEVSKITVKKQTPKFTTSSKTYKATAKTKALTATFKTVKGTPISGKLVKFTVNGKTYSAKTDENGVATVNVSLNKKGTYSFTAKFAGDNRFAAISKTAKLTIN